MQWEPTELEARSPRGTYLLYRVGDLWVCRFRPGTGDGGQTGRGTAIEPANGHSDAAAPAQAACAVHHGRLERGDTAEQASEWIRRHCEYLFAGMTGGVQ